VPEQPATNRPHDEADRKQQSRIQLLNDRIGAGEKGGGKVERESGVGVEVLPLHQISNGSDEDGLDPPPHVGGGDFLVRANGRVS
jgi:hypothetical protein